MASAEGRVVIVGGGGREHALAFALHSSGVPLLLLPGNGGSAALPGALCAPFTTVPAAVAQCKGARVVVVGPEAPLADGLCDALLAAGVPCFGPTAAAARLETSKAWSKAFMARHGIPTAAYGAFSVLAEAEAYITAAQHRCVVKASGLCAGKGVVVARDAAEALEAARAMLGPAAAFGAAGAEVVIEELLEGEEASVLAFSDGVTVVPLPAAQDHKRAWEFDQGPNTGGMGCYAPAPIVTPALMQRIVSTVLQPCVTGMAAEGCPFVGVLFAGLMIGADAAGQATLKVLEFNARLGDPETQTLLPLLQTPLLEVIEACTQARLGALAVRTRTDVVAATVVAAAPGYPGAYPTGAPITLSGAAAAAAAATAAGAPRAGAPAAAAPTAAYLFHAGTARRASDGALVTAGGRVLGATALAPSRAAALRAAYGVLEGAAFEGAWARRDIGSVGWERAGGGAAALRVGVLGSTRGTSLAGMLACAANEGGALLRGAELALVLSNVPGAGILDKAAAAGIPAQCIDSRAYVSRAAHEAALTAALQAAGVEVVVLCGYMRVLTPAFTERWQHRLLNVHPSLLPAHAGGMDLAVHAAVLAAGERVSGASVHVVTPEVDAGPVLVARACSVLPGDTPETLKARVQALEGEALCAAVGLYCDGSLLSALRRVGGGWGAWARLGGLLPPGRTPSAGELAALAAQGGGAGSGAGGAGGAGGGAGGGAKLTYAAAGVDIDAGDALVEAIKPMARSTRRRGADCDLGGFGGLFDLKAAGFRDPLLVSGTDGVGTKLRIAKSAGVHDTVGIDLVAMSVNDLVVQGAEPLVFLDYFATGALDVAQASAVVAGIAEGCRQAGCALVGGETAEMPSMYHDGDYDLAGFSFGAVERERVLPLLSEQRPGDVLLGLPSSGVHSNGFSLVRRICSAYGVDLQGPPPYASPHARLVDDLLTPTKIYIKSLLPALNLPGPPKVKALAHITGGGLPDNVHRGIAPGLVSRIDACAWPMPPVFQWLARVGAGVEPAEMARTFNCGIGMVAVVAREHQAEVTAALQAAGEKVYVLGALEAAPADGAGPLVVLDNLDKAFA